MSEELNIIQNEDGTFSEYDDTFDITIHCKSEEEQNEVLAKLNAPQPKMGHWKRINKEKYVQHAMSYYRCSECGKDIIGTHNYCPNCGAKMSEVDE